MQSCNGNKTVLICFSSMPIYTSEVAIIKLPVEFSRGLSPSIPVTRSPKKGKKVLHCAYTWDKARSKWGKFVRKGTRKNNKIVTLQGRKCWLVESKNDYCECWDQLASCIVRYSLSVIDLMPLISGDTSSSSSSLGGKPRVRAVAHWSMTPQSMAYLIECSK